MRIDVRMMAAAAAVLLVVAVGVGAHDAAADTVSAPIALGVAQSPRVVAISPGAGKVYVGNHLGNSVSVISTSSDTLLKTITGVSHPGAIHIGNDGRVYVPNHDTSTLSVFDSMNGDALIGSPATGGSVPSAVDTTPDDSRIVVTNEGSNTVTVFDHDLKLLKHITDLTDPAFSPLFSKPHAVVINPSGTKAYIANKTSSEVTVIDIAALTVTKHITVGADPDSMRFVGSTLWVANFLASPGTISRIDTTSDTVIDTITVGNSPHGLVDNADSSVVLVANQSSNTVTALSGVTGAIIPGADAIPVGISPQRIHMTDDGKRAYVPNELSDSVSVIDMASLKVIQTLDNAAGIGGSPSSLAVLGHSKVYVVNKNDNTVSVITIQYAPTASPTSPPAPTDTPRPGDTPLPTDTPVPGASATPRPADTPAPGQSPAPADPGAPADPAAPGPDGGVAGVAATPPPGATASAGTPAATSAASGTAKAGTPSVVPSRTAKATAAAGSIAENTGAASGADQPVAAAGGGGAPSWVWLAAGLGLVACIGAGGYFGRDWVATQLSRMRR